MPSPRILFAVTSASTMVPSGKPTGVWLEELTTPYYALMGHGAEVTVATIKGGPVPIDPRSLDPEALRIESVRRYQCDADLRRAMAETPGIAEIDEAEFDALFMPGGHGTMFDLPESARLAEIVSRFVEQDKVIAAVCHGPVGLVSAIDAKGRPVVAGRRIAGFTDSEERAVGLDGEVPFLLETRLRELGARYENGPDFEAFAIRDGAIVTGQNPASAEATAALLMQALNAPHASAA